MAHHKKREIIIHIGAPKTGTTAIQDYLSQNQDELAELNLFYPTIGRYYQGHHILAALASQSNDAHEFGWIPQPRGRIGDLLRKQLEATDKDAIVSSEALYYLQQPSELMRLLPLDVFDVVRVVIYLREALSWFRSLYLQCAKYGLTPASFESFFEELYPRYLDYFKLVDRWNNSSEKVKVECYDYHKAVRENGGSANHFLRRVICSEDTKDIENRISNSTLDVGCTEYLKNFYQCFPQVCMNSRSRINGSLSSFIQESEKYENTYHWSPSESFFRFYDKQRSWMKNYFGVELPLVTGLALPVFSEGEMVKVSMKIMASYLENEKKERMHIEKGIIGTDVRLVNFVKSYDHEQPFIVIGQAGYSNSAYRLLTQMGFYNTQEIVITEAFDGIGELDDLCLHNKQNDYVYLISSHRLYHEIRARLILEFHIKETNVF